MAARRTGDDLSNPDAVHLTDAVSVKHPLISAAVLVADGRYTPDGMREIIRASVALGAGLQRVGLKLSPEADGAWLLSMAISQVTHGANGAVSVDATKLSAYVDAVARYAPRLAQADRKSVV